MCRICESFVWSSRVFGSSFAFCRGGLEVVRVVQDGRDGC